MRTALFSFCLSDKQTTSHFIAMCDACCPQAAIDSSGEWQWAVSFGELCVCVFIGSVRPERPSVSKRPPQPEQRRKDNNPPHPWLNSPFAQQLCWNCFVLNCPHEKMENHHIKPSRSGQWFFKNCRFWVFFRSAASWHSKIMLTCVMFMFICCCLLQLNTDGGRSNVLLLFRVSEVYVTFPRLLRRGWALHF